MGNNRIVANALGTIIQSNKYYPFGMEFAESATAEQSKQPYKYNGKELDETHGLNWYDHSARHYDAGYITTPTVDPLSEKFYSWSPYVYCYNNPLKFIDKDGRFPTWVQVKHTAGEIASSLSGGIAAFADNILGGNTPIRGYAPYSDSQAFNNGLRSGDAASIVIGGLEIIQGVSSAEAGVAAAPVTDGASLVVTVAGVLEAVHGAIMMSAGSKKLNGEKGKVSEMSLDGNSG